jgi:hypothetical protein
VERSDAPKKDLVEMYNRPSEKYKSLSNVRFYLDGVITDSLDAAGISRRNGELMALRPQLMKLTDSEFESTIKAFRGIVAGNLMAVENKNSPKSPSYRDARMLYEDTRVQTGGMVSEVSQV